MNAEAWFGQLVDLMVARGVDTFYGSPGSRSTPLILAIHKHPETTLYMHADERGQAYRAVGYGRATGRPAGWVTTSGTAVANGFPAVVEASQDDVPLLCLTADRPPELRGTGANQTIDQVDLFGDYTLCFVDWPLPERVASREHWFHQPEGYEWELSTTGVVHWNFPIREPFDRDDYTSLDLSAWIPVQVGGASG